MSIFTYEEKDKLRKFLSLVDKIKQLALFKNGLPPAKLVIRVTKETHEEKLELPNEELLRSALLDLRKIFAQKEDTNFGSICNLIYKRVDDTEIKDRVAEIRKVYNGISINSSFIKIVIDGVEVTPAKCLDLWFNGYYFHENQRDKLFEVYKNFKNELKLQFFYAVRQTTKCAIVLSKIAQEIIEL